MTPPAVAGPPVPPGDPASAFLTSMQWWEALLVFGGLPLLAVLLIALPFYGRRWWAVLTGRRRGGGPR